jgi:hypothetical protein
MVDRAPTGGTGDRAQTPTVPAASSEVVLRLRAADRAVAEFDVSRDNPAVVRLRQWARWHAAVEREGAGV